MQLQYGVDDRPPWWKTLLLGLQWSAILVPSIMTLGRAVGSLGPVEAAVQAGYLQRLFVVSAVTLVAQAFWGHRLPVISGPSAILLVAVLATGGDAPSAVHTSIFLGGVFLTILAASGLLKPIRVLFTDNVVAVVLLLISFTLAPTTLRLLTAADSGVAPSANLLFAFGLTVVMFVAHRWLTGIWRATVIVWSMMIGSLAYRLLFPDSALIKMTTATCSLADFLAGWEFVPRVQVGALLSFLLCYLAVSINDLGSIQSMNRLLDIPDMDRRVSRGIAVTGFANILSGLLGVVGPVNYSLSPGVVMSTRCASRFTLLPAAAIVGILPFLPSAMSLVTAVPSAVIGCVLLYVLTSQVAAGMSILFEHQMGGPFRWEDGLIIGLPLLLGTIIAFLPVGVLDTLPVVLRPILGNGFVVGVVAALLMEHVILRQ